MFHKNLILLFQFFNVFGRNIAKFRVGVKSEKTRSDFYVIKIRLATLRDEKAVIQRKYFCLITASGNFYKDLCKFYF